MGRGNSPNGFPFLTGITINSRSAWFADLTSPASVTQTSSVRRERRAAGKEPGSRAGVAKVEIERARDRGVDIHTACPVSRLAVVAQKQTGIRGESRSPPAADSVEHPRGC